jgi:hypothetical protein
MRGAETYRRVGVSAYDREKRRQAVEDENDNEHQYDLGGGVQDY